ncbi:MAG: FAD-binding and (Fe-S)-binding domain-containing protein [Actinomycetales bacterium]
MEERPAPGSDVDRSPLDDAARERLAHALRDAVRGEVRFDSQARALYAADSSNYRQIPLGVVFPLDENDVVATLRVCAEHDAPVLSRGAGTGLAGQTCNVAVVLDFSRHMNRILEIDPTTKTARVQPGVVLDDLRAAAEEHGLTFGPDPATHAWCTLGGMIGNNSCGTHALFAGKTVDNVAALRVATYGGEVLDVGAYSDEAYARAVGDGGEKARILGGLRELSRRYAELVRERFPDIPRRVSGYNLDDLLPEKGFHVARALVGSESTCVVVTEATLHLSHSPRHRRVVVLGYPDIFLAADAVPSLLESAPLLGLEGFDITLVRQMRKANLNTEHLELLPEGEGWLLAELGDDDPAEADRLTDAFVANLPDGVAWRRYDGAGEQRRVWAIRESGLGATARPPGDHPNHEGWEDAAVEPRNLGAYLREITALWGEYGYSGAWYGHFGQGCVHTRNPFDLHTLEGLAAYRSYVERAADICVSYGGSLSGEHGDGQARGELLERMYGPELIEAFRQFKAIWDPRDRMNPGKLVDPYPLDTNLKHGPLLRQTVLQPTFFAFVDDGGSLQEAADRCVGVGRCRRTDTGVMCPSYRATGEERHATRGRARLLAEMMQGQATPETWRNDDVHDALDLCLSCKGCAVDCPTHVDMATYKSEFEAHYWAGRRRPRVMYALGFLPWAARLAKRVPALANVGLGEHPVGRLARRAAGVTTRRPAPKFAATPFRQSPLARLSAPVSDATVVVFADTFTDSFRPGMGEAAVAALSAAGERVAVPQEWACCGRTLYDGGLLTQARRTLRQLLDVLQPWIDRDVPVVVPEPSCLAAFRDELPALLSDDPRAAKLAALARSVSEQLLLSPALQTPGAMSTSDPDSNAAVVAPHRGRVLVHPHCHGRAVGTPKADRAVLERLGYEVEILDAGCCGLAGSFGYEPHKEPVSRRIGEEFWLPRLRERVAAGQPTALLVDGFSCVMQLDQLTTAADPASCVRQSTLPELVREALARR